jgi:hypothetical protein
MACETKQQTATRTETLEIVECEESPISNQIDSEDYKARELRKHLAQQKALRELEQRKAHALAVSHRLSFIM